ncbi:MAG: nickel-responsive transcriptional regulator NikR [Thermoprotei archaeon]|nr:MAG: nickel-responsive transcriptional regulator NikR [Thermoprotei archaeon]
MSEIVSISLDQSLLRKIENIMMKQGYSSRSELIRDAVRKLIADYEMAEFESRQVITAIVVIYEYKEGYVSKRLTGIRHEFDDIIIGSLHVHVNNYCTELLIARGEAKAVLRLISVIRGIRGLSSFRYLSVPLEIYNPN